MFANRAHSVPTVGERPTESVAGVAERTTRRLSMVVIDRRALTRQCLSYWLEANGHEFQITSIASATQIVEVGNSVKRTDLILLCIGASRVTSSEVRYDIGLLVRRWADVPVALLADHEEIDDIGEAIQRGVRGFLPTSLDAAAAAEALRFVRAGGTFVPASALVRLTEDLQQTRQARLLPREEDLLQRLTPREQQVLARLRQGKPNKTIARELQISESTVKVFVCRILTKLNAQNRTELAYRTQALALSEPSLSSIRLVEDDGSVVRQRSPRPGQA